MENVFHPFPILRCFILCLSIFISSNSSAQSQNVFFRAWVQNGGTLTPNFAQPVVTVVNGSGETFVAGSAANAYNTQSMLLTKYSSGGTPVWNQTFEINAAGNTWRSVIRKTLGNY